MEVLSFIALILLSLVGYSAGAVGKAGKVVDLKPQLIDLILVLIIWAGAIYSRSAFGLNKWLLILMWVLLSVITGMVAASFRNPPQEKIPGTKESKKVPSNQFQTLWQSWKNFSRRMGNFESRVILSLFFFVFVSPFALAVKMFSDPLKIKHQGSKSHWLPRKGEKIDLEQFRRQS